MGNPKLIVDGGKLLPPIVGTLPDDKNILVKAYNDVSHNPAEIFKGKTVTFFPLGSNQSITLTFRGVNPFGWSSATKSGVQGKALNITGPAGIYTYEARLTPGSASGNPDPKLVVK